MDAAREEQAGGGTVLHAKGTGMEKAEKFLGFSLVNEKEMVFIVVKTATKNRIMRALSSRCMAPFTERQVDRVTTEKVTTFSVFSRPK